MGTPNGWTRVRVGDVLEEYGGRNPGTGELPVLSVTKNNGIMLASERFGKQIHGRNLSKYRVAPRDSIVVDPMLLWSGTIGRQKQVDVGLVSPDYRVYRVGELGYVPFIEHASRGHQLMSQFQAGARGTNVRRNRISRSDFLALGLDLPPLPEQRKIAAILSSVDEAIEATQAVIDQVQVVKEGLMQELLTTGLPGRHKRFKQSEIGQIPEEWEVVELGDVLDRIETGWSPRCDSHPAGLDEWGVLKVSAVSWGRFRPEENKRLAEGLEPRVHAEVRQGDVILSRANTTELVGRPVLVDETRSRLMLSDKTLRLVPGPQLEKRFLVRTLLGPSARQQIEDKATGSSKSMKNISQSKLRSVRFPLPSVDEQKEIANVAAAFANREEEEGRSMQQLQTLKHALMSVLLSGELRVHPEAAE